MKNKTKLKRFFATLRMTSKRTAFTLAEVPEARQYGSKNELSAVAKVEPEARQYRSKQAAFTLAEVLIALGIIGIVAAMTIPTLMKNYEKKVTVIRLKQAYSEIQNAVKLSTIDNGDSTQWSVEYNSGISTFVQNYYLPYFKSARFFVPSYNIKNLRGDSTITPRAGIKLSNGTHLLFYGEGSASAWLFIDVNGAVKPNRIGRDVFVLNFANKGKFIPVFYGEGRSRTDLISDGIGLGDDVKETNRAGLGCSFDNKNGWYAGYFCGALIKADNWTIADDYPW